MPPPRLPEGHRSPDPGSRPLPPATGDRVEAAFPGQWPEYQVFPEADDGPDRAGIVPRVPNNDRSLGKRDGVPLSLPIHPAIPVTVRVLGSPDK